MRSLAIAALLLAATSRPSEVTFPGHDRAPDPTGRRAVVYRELKSPNENPHELSLRDLRTGNQARVLTFARGAVVLWSPDGNAFAVTDRGGSNFSDLVVFAVDYPQSPIDVGEELTRVLGLLPERQMNHHVYLEAVSWQTSRTLRFRIRGYGSHDPSGFEELFDYSLEGKVVRAGHAASR